MRRTIFFFTLAALAALLATRARANDELVRNDGRVLRGQILEVKEKESVRIKTEAGEEYLLDWHEIRSLRGERLEAAAASPALSPTPATDLRPEAPGVFSDQKWLFYFAGGSFLGLESSRQQDRDSAIVSVYGPGNVFPLTLDIGAYWPRKNRQWALGFNLSRNQNLRLFRDNANIFTLYDVNLITYAFSAYYSPKGPLGDGWAIRADAGPVLGNYQVMQGLTELHQEHWGGVGLGLGVSYLVGENPENRFVPTLLTSLRFADQDLYAHLALTLGGLW